MGYLPWWVSGEALGRSTNLLSRSSGKADTHTCPTDIVRSGGGRAGTGVPPGGYPCQVVPGRVDKPSPSGETDERRGPGPVPGLGRSRPPCSAGCHALSSISQVHQARHVLQSDQRPRTRAIHTLLTTMMT
jgi:hypothetical protein